MTDLARIVSIERHPSKPWMVVEVLACGHRQEAQKHAARSRYCRQCMRVGATRDRQIAEHRARRRELDQRGREMRTTLLARRRAESAATVGE